jgi:hypothetical protein
MNRMARILAAANRIPPSKDQLTESRKQGCILYKPLEWKAVLEIKTSYRYTYHIISRCRDWVSGR